MDENTKTVCLALIGLGSTLIGYLFGYLHSKLRNRNSGNSSHNKP